MSEGVLVAIITIALGGVVSAATTAWLKRLNKNHDAAIVDDLVTTTLQRELKRVYDQQAAFEQKIDSQAERLTKQALKVESLEEAVDLAERRADAADRRADKAERVADVARENSVKLLAHVGLLEQAIDRRLPPPPPPRPVLRLTEEPA